MFPYIHFSGNCSEAMDYYAALFGATDLQKMRYGDVPAGDAPPGEPSQLVMHSQLTAMGSTLMASDFPPGVPGERQQAVSIMLAPPTVAEARRLFDGLKEGGVIVDFGPTFWSKGFGMTKDQFGTHWIIGASGD